MVCFHTQSEVWCEPFSFSSPPSFWFRPDWPEHQLLRLYPSTAADDDDDEEAAEDDDEDEDDGVQL